MLVASDGLVARDSGIWALDKLDRLDRYATMVTTAMKSKWSNGLMFIDLMAGPGVCVDSRTGLEFPGSTLRALGTRHPFDRTFAVELSPENAQALDVRVRQHSRGAHAIVRCANCNSDEVIREIRDLSTGALCLMFVDLIGTEVTMETLRRLTERRTIDLVITWPEMDTNRNRGKLIEQTERWAPFFGAPEWVDIAKLGPVRRVKGLRDLYRQQLTKLGYRTVLSNSVKNTRGGHLYKPLFATRHPRGEQFWNASAPTAPPTLFEL